MFYITTFVDCIPQFDGTDETDDTTADTESADTETVNQTEEAA